MECKLCKKELNLDHVQQGGLHLDCFNTGIDVYRVTLIEDCGKGGYLERDPAAIAATIESLDTGEGYVIRKGIMLAGEYFNLPEFEGF